MGREGERREGARQERMKRGRGMKDLVDKSITLRTEVLVKEKRCGQEGLDS